LTVIYGVHTLTIDGQLLETPTQVLLS